MTTKTILAFAMLTLAGCAPVMANTLTTVSLTLWGETRNQDYNGKHAVASTIWNRAKANPAKFQAVCLAPHQYSCWHKRVFTQSMPDLRKPLDRLAWHDCVALASSMMDGTFLPSLESKHYHEASVRPYWAHDYRMIAQIGSHRFYR